MEPVEIDLVKYGVLWERVQNMDKKMDKTIASAVGGAVARIVGHLRG